MDKRRMDTDGGKTYTAAILGAGRIACGFDAPGQGRVLTHAHALTDNPRTKLAAIVDTDAKTLEREARRWSAAPFSNIGEMFGSVQPDIVVIATPDATHADMLESAVALEPRLIICEKPVATTSEEAFRVGKLVRSPVPVLVNFSRRFDDTAVRTAREIKEGKYGAVISASGIYDRGIFHNGSHMLDFARMFFGEMKSAAAHFSLADYPDGAASVGGIASFEHCPEFYLSHGDGRRYSIFELDIILEKARARFCDGGRTLGIQNVVPDALFAGFNGLGEPKFETTQLEYALSALYRHAALLLDGREEPRSTLADALKTHEACARFASFLK